MTAFGSRVNTSGLNVNDGCVRVPAARGEAGAEVDDRVERDRFARNVSTMRSSWRSSSSVRCDCM